MSFLCQISKEGTFLPGYHHRHTHTSPLTIPSPKSKNAFLSASAPESLESACVCFLHSAPLLLSCVGFLEIHSQSLSRKTQGLSKHQILSKVFQSPDSRNLQGVTLWSFCKDQQPSVTDKTSYPPGALFRIPVSFIRRLGKRAERFQHEEQLSTSSLTLLAFTDPRTQSIEMQPSELACAFVFLPEEIFRPFEAGSNHLYRFFSLYMVVFSYMPSCGACVPFVAIFISNRNHNNNI